MEGKVKCTCGWSWNKSDSSKKDMYICHECGRDNSNNMKNGGWLDNYNDSQASAPEGMEGDGFSNVGRNYSPAWGGSFQMGGSVYPVNYVPQAAMGGSIPGAVGFSYARTQGAAPSNGKYAKKTLPSAQNGQEMQYYREGLDFQPKTISKNGGWLDGYDKAQNGYTTGDKVTYDTPEYTEAYNKGEVVTEDGQRSPILLDEVTIQNDYRRPRGFWEQYRDKIIDENRDAGPLGAAVGVPLSATFSLPQLAMMKGFTGEMQRPSEAIGFNNDEGAFANPVSFGRHASNFLLDAVTDPTNLIGAGVLTKENALAKIAASKESGLLSNAYKLNPKAITHENFNNSNSFYRQIDTPTFNEGVKSGLIKGKQNINKTQGEGIINLNKSFGDDAYYFKGKLYSPQRADYIYEVNKGEEFFKPRVNNKDYLKKGVPYTVENTNVRVSKTPIPLEEATIYKKHWLQGYKEVPKQEEGGIIKDDMGQWAHPGEITEIGSNDITMEGVPYDVLGVSDTGDTKLMKPGKNYKFKGKKVTEYPMAKNGVNQQDQKTLQQLDQLTNFTNYNKPQPGGWLNKYN